MIVGEDQIQIGSWSMRNGCLFGTNDFKIFVMHQSIMNHFSTMIPTLFGSDALLVLLLVILLCVLNNKKVICQIQRHMKQWGKRVELTKMVLFQAFLCGMFGGSVGQTMYLQSLVYTSPTFVSAMFNLIPAITFIVAIILMLEKLGWHSAAGKAKVFGTIVCITGAMFLSLYKGPEINMGRTNINLLHSPKHKGESKPLLGAFLAVAGCTCYALLLIVQAKAAKRYPCPYSFTALLNVMAAVQCFVVAVVVEGDWKQWKLGWNIRLLASAYTGIFVSGVLFTIIAWVVRMKGPVYVSVFNPLMLVMVAITGYLFMGEKLFLGSIVGSVVIVCGLYVVLWGKDKEIKKVSQLVPDKEETDIKSMSHKGSK